MCEIHYQSLVTLSAMKYQNPYILDEPRANDNQNEVAPSTLKVGGPGPSQIYHTDFSLYIFCYTITLEKILPIFFKKANNRKTRKE